MNWNMFSKTQKRFKHGEKRTALRMSLFMEPKFVCRRWNIFQASSFHVPVAYCRTSISNSWSFAVTIANHFEHSCSPKKTEFDMPAQERTLRLSSSSIVLLSVAIFSDAWYERKFLSVSESVFSASSSVKQDYYIIMQLYADKIIKLNEEHPLGQTPAFSLLSTSYRYPSINSGIPRNAQKSNLRGDLDNQPNTMNERHEKKAEDMF